MIRHATAAGTSRGARASACRSRARPDSSAPRCVNAIETTPNTAKIASQYVTAQKIVATKYPYPFMSEYVYDVNWPGRYSVFCQPKLYRIGCITKIAMTIPCPRNLFDTTVCTNMDRSAHASTWGNVTMYSSFTYCRNS